MDARKKACSIVLLVIQVIENLTVEKITNSSRKRSIRERTLHHHERQIKPATDVEAAS